VARITALQLSYRVVEKTIVAERVCAAAGEKRGDVLGLEVVQRPCIPLICQRRWRSMLAGHYRSPGAENQRRDVITLSPQIATGKTLIGALGESRRRTLGKYRRRGPRYPRSERRGCPAGGARLTAVHMRDRSANALVRLLGPG
jgi:hypothetical protein